VPAGVPIPLVQNISTADPELRALHCTGAAAAT
jgi:hypothetical protein